MSRPEEAATVTDWSTVVDGYARSLQLQRSGEEEGWIGTEEDFIFNRVFEDPQQALGLYEALVSSGDPQARIKALDGLDKLGAVDQKIADRFLGTLMSDPDPQVKQAAQLFAAQYG